MKHRETNGRAKRPLSVRQLAKLYGVAPSTLDRYMHRGALIEDPLKLLRWMGDNAERFGPLLDLLLAPDAIRDLTAAIRRLES